jgi:lysophospholipase L1-like esterase
MIAMVAVSLGFVASAGALAAEPIRIVILGDSTVCDYPEKAPTRGWGQYVAEGFREPVKVINLAKSGRSTKTFKREGLLQKSLDQKADFALIQFGHNDSHAKERPEATDANGDFKEYLREYVDAFRKVGTVPILVTPMHRRIFKDGKPAGELRPYADAMKAVAQEKDVKLVDLFTSSGSLFARLGDAGSADLSSSATDRTHFSEKGARAMAELVLVELKKVEPRVAKVIR